MAKGDPNSKAAEKKRQRVAMQRKMDARVAIVKTANLQDDPLASLPSFKKYNKNDVDLTLSTKRVTDLSQDKKEVIIDLLEINMKKLYEESEWGWNAKNKRDEMLDDHAWYLLAEKPDGTIVGFSHFRFDMDYDDEVLYVYEIQIDPNYQRKGLGRFMMQVLELLAFKADMRKIMLTAFKHNLEAGKFFKKTMKYEVDETNPVDHVDEMAAGIKEYDYEILSKFNKRKVAREEAEDACSEMKVTCCSKC